MLKYTITIKEKQMIVDFSSDTTSGVNNEIIEAIVKANKGCMQGYFKDDYTKEVKEIIQKEFSVPVNTLFVSNGTAVNILALRVLLQGSVSSILCDEITHISK